MGRYISTGTAQVNSCTSYTATTCYQVSCHQYAYDANECWQNRVMLTRPGSYTFTMPAGTSGCLRAIAVGGGGKALCSDFYCNFAGSGGGYAESVYSVNAGCTVTIVVGRQMQDTTISFVCAGGGTINMTGGGATQSGNSAIPGTGSGGNFMNSRGGCGGWGRNYQETCGTCPSTCICTIATTCCGYCVVYMCSCISHTQNTICGVYYPGGGSAGSFMYPCGGCGQTVCMDGANRGSYSGGPVAGGGGGIGYINRQILWTATCTCICRHYGSSSQPGVCAPSQAGGGGGTRWTLCHSPCDNYLWTGCCTMGWWREGAGDFGGCDNQEGRPGAMYWYCTPCMCTGRSEHEVCCSIAPRRYSWHDIHCMSGSGGSGKNINFCMNGPDQGNMWVRGYNRTGVPEDAGEGAGTGGAVYVVCQIDYLDWPRDATQDQVTGINWTMVCQLGLCNRAGDAYNPDMMRQIVPGHISYAGTLGGSGGIGVCGYGSKAGFGGGAGVNKTFISCVCWGGNFNLCNGSGPALAFPPCILDNIASTAGSGMAIIYWKD